MELTAEAQLFIFLEDLQKAIMDAVELTNEDPERSKRVLRAIATDMKTLRSLLWHLLGP